MNQEELQRIITEAKEELGCVKITFFSSLLPQCWNITLVSSVCYLFWHLCWIRELAAGDEEEEDEGIEAEPHLNSHSRDISAATADDSKQQKGEDDDLAEYELDKYDDEEDTGRNY